MIIYEVAGWKHNPEYLKENKMTPSSDNTFYIPPPLQHFQWPQLVQYQFIPPMPAPYIVLSGLLMFPPTTIPTISTTTTANTWGPTIPLTLAPIPASRTSFSFTFASDIIIESMAQYVTTHFIGMCLIFKELKEHKSRVVDKREALKFVSLSFNPYWSEAQKQRVPEFRDDEWHVYFKKAETSEEHLQAFDSNKDQIKELLSCEE